MKNKRFFALNFIFFLISSFVVNAQRETFMPEIIEKFARFLFFDLSNLAKSSSDVFVIYAKFIFFLLVFSILYWGSTKIPGLSTRLGGTITFIFALISTILVPRSLLIFIFETYSTLIGFFFAFVPFIIGLLFAHRVLPGDSRFERVMRGLIYIAMSVFTFALVGTLRGLNDPLYLELAKWAEVGAFITLIAALASFLGGIGRGGGGGHEGGLLPEGDGGRREGRGPIRRYRDWLDRRRRRRDLRNEIRFIRNINETANRMQMRYATMAGICGPQGISINNAYRHLRGLPVNPHLTPIQMQHLDLNRVTLNELHANWLMDWDALYNQINQIATLSNDLRLRVIRELTRPI